MPIDDTNFALSINETTALLIRARSFLKRGWCRNALALDRKGNDVDPTDHRAVAWCAVGALVAAAGGYS
jgi:hypothetical protein